VVWLLLLPSVLFSVVSSHFSVGEGYMDFPNTLELPQNSRCQNGGMKQVRYKGPTNSRHHRTKLSCPGTPVLGFVHSCHKLLSNHCHFIQKCCVSVEHCECQCGTMIRSPNH
jgi:hypothetical protein